MSHSAYCRSTPASRLATSTKVLLLLGCLCTLFSFPPPLSRPLPPSSSPSSSSSSSSSASQVSVSTLVLVDDVPAAAQLFPHVGHLQAEGGVLPLQEGGAHRDLVLLQPPGVPRALRRLVVLDAPTPVLLILSSAAVWYVGVCGKEKVGGGEREEQKQKRGERSEKGQLCDERNEKEEGKEEKQQKLSSCNNRTQKPRQHLQDGKKRLNHVIYTTAEENTSDWLARMESSTTNTGLWISLCKYKCIRLWHILKGAKCKNFSSKQSKINSRMCRNHRADVSMLT